MTVMINRHALVDQVAAGITPGLAIPDAARVRSLLDELVSDWYREAGNDSDAPDVIALLRKELDAALADKPAAVRMEIVRAAVLDRRVRRLGVQTLALGKQLIDGTIAQEDARAQGESLMKQIEEVAAEVRTLADAGVRARLARDVQEASMEALYAIEGKAMSHRLSHYARDTQPPRVF